jgi:hypothetical protein
MKRDKRVTETRQRPSTTDENKYLTRRVTKIST